MIADLLIILSIILSIIWGVRKGIAKTLFGVAALIAASFFAHFLAENLSNFVYDDFIKQSVVTNLEQMVNSNGVNYAIENSLEAVPEWIFSIMTVISGVFGADIDKYQSSIMLKNGTSQNEITKNITNSIEQTLQPVITGVLQILLYVILFIIVYIIVKLIAGKLLFLFNAPIIRHVNRALGGILGAVEGLIFVFIAVNAFCIISAVANSDLLNETMIRGDLFNFFSLTC